VANPLKAGSTGDFAASMAEAMFNAMQAEWQAAYGTPLPGGAGELDRRILFAAVAQGLLGYLKAHRGDLVTDVVHDDTTHGHAHRMNFDVEDV
jgi:hypothetical protein